MSNYRALLSDLFLRTADGMKLGLACTRALLDAWDSPDERSRLILVAGTNGKGSTSARLAAALQAAGYRVGLFTSPHLLRFTERIRIDGKELSQGEVEILYGRLRQLEEQTGVRGTFFECATVMALGAFADAGVDVSVLEIGMGGRLDATNAVRRRELAIITPIGLDHTRWLGTSLAQIAAEKADIIPRGGTVVVAPQSPEALAVIEKVAQERCALLVHSPSVERAQQGEELEFVGGPFHEPLRLRSDLVAPYQIQNLATVGAACSELRRKGWAMDLGQAMGAAADCPWPGRYQWLQPATGPRVLVDGAHNLPGLQALFEALHVDPETRGRPLHCVFTALKGKDADAMAAFVAARATSLHLTPTGSARSRDRAELQSLRTDATVHESPAQAIAAAARRAESDAGVVLVTGSLFLVADAHCLLGGEARDPPVDA